MSALAIMTLIIKMSSALLVAASAEALAQTDGGPPSSASIDMPATDLPRETYIENSLSGARPASGTAVGGYGELTLNAPIGGTSIVDLRRVVFYFGHDFTDRLRFYSELEFEHAVASSSDRGEAEIEQAYLDWLWTPKLNLRAGVIIMPAGIINVYHEPPSFFGVDRPDVDLYVIPTTWREPGLGIFGELAEGLRYQLYIVGGFNAAGFSAQYGLATGHQEAQFQLGADVGAIARVDFEPWLGTVFGATAYGGLAGPGAESTGALPLGVPASSLNSLPASVGSVPVGLFDLDARTRTRGFTARLELALVTIGDARALDQALLALDGAAFQGPVSSLLYGATAEVGYDLLRLLAPTASQSLTLFVRFDGVDTQAAVPEGFTALSAMRRYSGMLGLVYKPIPQIAFKLDDRYQGASETASYDQIDAAITWLF